jgi:hypothetical protein
LVVPFVVTWMGWPTISAPGVHAGCAKAAAGSVAAAVSTIAVRTRMQLFMIPVPF